jgi:photosystem II stability/assembly factor-like uncharacterized protein
LYTTDGGQSWQGTAIDDPALASASIISVDMPHFLNAQEGWLAINGALGMDDAVTDIWHTTNGGQNWNKITSSGAPSGLMFGYSTGISFEDTHNGIAAGSPVLTAVNPAYPVVNITHDGGNTWQRKQLPLPQGGAAPLNSITTPPVFFGNTVLLPVNVTAQGGQDQLILYRSNDGGADWFQTQVVDIRASTVYVLNPDHAWTHDILTGKLYSTNDGGTDWFPTSSSTSNITTDIITLSFTDANTGWAITAQSLLHTIDGGKTWRKINYSIQ